MVSSLALHNQPGFAVNALSKVLNGYRHPSRRHAGRVGNGRDETIDVHLGDADLLRPSGVVAERLPPCINRGGKSLTVKTIQMAVGRERFSTLRSPVGWVVRVDKVQTESQLVNIVGQIDGGREIRAVEVRDRSFGKQGNNRRNPHADNNGRQPGFHQRESAMGVPVFPGDG